MVPPCKLSVIVPCYNEEASVAELHRRVTAACQAAVGSDYELVLVNDGSRDGTWNRLAALAAADPHLRCVDLTRNYGHQCAVTAGLALCRGERVLLLDADLQDPPELLPAMLAKMDEGFDVVYGQRRSRDGDGVFKRATAALFYRLLRRLADVDIPQDTGDFRLMRRTVVEALNALPEQHRFVRGMVAWVGFRQTAVTYDREQRRAGETHYPFWKMASLAIDAITSFSIVPLRLIVTLAGLTFLASLGLMVYVAVSWAYFNAVQGWTSLISVVLFLGSVQLLSLGIIGEYVGRTFIESKRRPAYLIREVLQAGSEQPVASRE
ncbi:MAG TPA: glycosyltransferase family 2 protein [Lacunisphaera sp.]|nr:glycosyltransferase family 2 protein [Lacunisphaera sp.]